MAKKKKNRIPEPGDYLLTENKQVYRITEIVQFWDNSRQGRCSSPTYNLRSMHTIKSSSYDMNEGNMVWDDAPIELKGMTLLELRTFGKIISGDKATNMLDILY